MQPIPDAALKPQARVGTQHFFSGAQSGKPGSSWATADLTDRSTDAPDPGLKAGNSSRLAGQSGAGRYK